MKVSVRGVRPLQVQNKFAVELACGHVLVIDRTVDTPWRFQRRCKVECLTCKWGEQFELGGEA